MKRLANDMFHDEAMHEGLRHLGFIVGLAATIIVLHRILYYLVY
ncbi:MAG: hypothetical protein ABR538_05495 [Candidatus Binatia bacterium]